MLMSKRGAREMKGLGWTAPHSGLFIIILITILIIVLILISVVVVVVVHRHIFLVDESGATSIVAAMYVFKTR